MVAACSEPAEFRQISVIPVPVYLMQCEAYLCSGSVGQIDTGLKRERTRSS
jgi:hypothetical protein